MSAIRASLLKPITWYGTVDRHRVGRDSSINTEQRDTWGRSKISIRPESGNASKKNGGVYSKPVKLQSVAISRRTVST